jgi:flagellar hook assembly protein FlgD
MSTCKSTWALGYGISADYGRLSGLPGAVPKTHRETRSTRTEIVSLGPVPASTMQMIHVRAGSGKEQVRLDLYDVSGRLVRRLLDGQIPAGDTVLSWDGKDGNGRPVASGIYWYRLATEDGAVTRRAVIVR